MKIPVRSMAILLLASSAFACFAQNSAAGYGQGRGGGGFGGGGMISRAKGQMSGLAPGNINFISYNPTDNSLIVGSRDQPGLGRLEGDQQQANLWTSKSAILSAGEHVDFKFKVQKGETLMAGVTSDAFDPALSLEDAHGTVLAKNDDRADGDQSPFIAYRFAEAGEYTVKVLSSHSVSGGKFTLGTRSFISCEMPVGVSDQSDPRTLEDSAQGRAVFRIAVKKGTIYDLHQVMERFRDSAGHNQIYGLSFYRVITPSGVITADLAPIASPDGMPVFQALVDGDFYVDYTMPGIPNSSTGKTFKLDLRTVKTVITKPADDQSLTFEPGELKLVEFPVTPNQIVETKLKGVAFQSVLSAPDESNTEITKRTSVLEGGGAYGQGPAWSWYRPNVDSNNDLVRVFRGSGMARMAIRSQSGEAMTLSFKNVESLPAWSEGEALKASLEVGDSRLFLMKSSNSELMRVAATASHFLPRLDIFRLDGELANSLCNRVTHLAGDDLYFPDAGTFIVRLSCEGDGGSGDFEMKRQALTPMAYKLDAVQTIKLDGKNFGLYSVDLQANKRYQLMIDQPYQPLQIDLLDDDGQFLTSQQIGFDKVVLHYFIPTKSGRHRLWLRGGPGERKFQFDLHNPPAFGAEKAGRATA